jgi:hypothetical protein
MAVPDTKVFIAFDLTDSLGSYFALDDPVRGVLNSNYILGGDVLYDVTDHVASVSIGRGKSNELDRYTAGNASITLHNDDRHFDPFYVDGPFYTQIVPRKQVAIETNGIRQYTGFIDDWDLSYQLGNKSFASVNCVDGFLQLNATQLDAFTNVEELSGDRIVTILNRPEVAWPSANRIIETGTRTLQADSVDQNTNLLSYLQVIEDTEVGSLFMDKDGALNFQDRIVGPPLTDTLIFSDEQSGAIPERTNLIPNPSFETDLTNWTGTNFISSQSSTYSKYGTYSWKGVVFTTGTNRYMDKLQSDVFITTGFTYTYSCWVYLPATNTADVTLGLWAYGWNATGYSGPTVLQTKLVTRGVWTRLSGSFNSLNGTTGAATNVLLRVINQSSWAVGQEMYVDGALLEQTDSLNEYFDGNTSGALWNGTQNLSTSTIPAYVSVSYSDIQVVYGSENLYNRVVVTRKSGTPQIADSVNSQALYGIQTLSLDNLLLVSDSDALDLANYLLGVYDEPDLRISSVEVNLHDKNPEQQGKLLEVELQDVYKIVFTPNGVGDPFEQYAYVTGISHSIGIDQHKITFDFGSIRKFPFILDHPIYGVLGGGLPLYDALNAIYDEPTVRYDGSQNTGNAPSMSRPLSR